MKPDIRDELPRRLFLVSLALAVLGGAFFYGVIAERDSLPPVPQVRTAYAALKGKDLTNDPRRHHLQPSRGQGAGVTVNDVPDDGAVVLLAGFFDDENQIRLVERDGKVLHAWSLDYFDHFPDPQQRACGLASSLWVDTHGVHVTPQGDVVFNYEYCGTVKLDRCGEVIWTIPKQTHHSVVAAEAGGYWVLGRDQWLASEDPERLTPLTSEAVYPTILEDTLLRISEDGEVLEEISIPEVMREGGLEAVLTANAGLVFPLSTTVNGWELVHANKATELSSELAASYPQFAAGDLAISLRGRNLVFVLDPATKAVKWHQIGPWLRQHDPEFRPDGRLSIFNNNVYITAYENEQTDLSTPFTTNIMAVDPQTGETEVVFGEAPGQEMLSVLRGDHQLLDDGGMLITEFDGGRVLEVDADGQIVWEYVNHYDDDFVGEITNAAVYPADHFETDWQTCT
jgi:hypothetical protein